MKISVEKGMDKPFLRDGSHTVEITHIEEGTSEHKQIPFFACRFENEEGFVTQRFYLSKAGMPIIMSLFRALGIDIQEGEQVDTKELLHKKLTIQVEERSYTDPETGNERTLKQATEFK